MKMNLQLFGGRGGGSGLSGGSAGGKMGIAEIRANENTREMLDNIEEAHEEIIGRGLSMNDDDFWVHAYKDNVQRLYNETGFDYDKSVEKQETQRRNQAKADEIAKGRERSKELRGDKVGMTYLRSAKRGDQVIDGNGVTWTNRGQTFDGYDWRGSNGSKASSFYLAQYSKELGGGVYKLKKKQS